MSETKLTERIQDSLTLAIKSSDPLKVRTLRLMLAALKDKEINLRTEKSLIEITDEVVIKMLRSMIKQREESIQYFKQGARDDLANQEMKEIEVIKEFLPIQMNEDKTLKAVEEIIEQTQASTLRDISKIVGLLQKNYGDTVDMSIAMKFVMQKLKSNDKTN